MYVPGIIYGGIDGTITTFAIMAGSIGSNQKTSTILILSLASLFADGFSMGISAHESTIHSGEYTPFQIAVTTFISFVMIGSIPITTYYLFRKKNKKTKLIATVVSSLLCLFLIGALKGYIMEKNILTSSFSTLSLGIIAGMISYYIAHWLKNKLKE